MEKVMKLFRKRSDSLVEEIRALKRMGKAQRKRQRLASSWNRWFDC